MLMAGSQLGDEFLGKIHHGDCVAGMNSLPAGSIDLVFADPPFNIGYDYDVYHDAKGYDQYLGWSREWIGAVHRALKPDGTFWLAIGDEYAAELKIESQKIGFHIRSWVIWYYTFGVNCKTKFSRSHAHLFHFVKNPKRFTFRADDPANRIPSARLLVYGDSRGNPEGRLPDDTWILRPQDLADRFATNEDTWYFPRVAGTFKERAGFHGCQMPEQLLARIIRICSHDNDVVLDPFSGSATTLAVAKKLKRRFIGFDLSPDYVKRGTERLAEIRVGDALIGSAEPTMSAPKTTAAKRKGRSAKSTAKESPLETVLKNSELAQEEWSDKVYVRGIIEAFTRVRDGYSADRVVLDPALNQGFAEECFRVGIAGDIRAWNNALFQLRKDGKLAHLPTTRRTEISWEQCDSFLFASEIAWKQMLDEGYASLDEILCDPVAADHFDSIAREYAPDCKSLECRLGALKLRKAAKVARTDSKTLRFGRLEAPITVSAANWSKIPNSRGAYLVVDADDERPLYAGESLDLRTRFTYQFSSETRKSIKSWGRRLALRFLLVEREPTRLLAYQSLFVRRFSPPHNLPDLAFA
jgi:site-specific DNA-methyltransferase (adenine-specific)